MRNYSQREQWFIERIGKVVYRNATTCACEVCKNVHQSGLFIKDENHALYIAEIELCYTSDGHPLKYFDTKEEAANFEINNPPAAVKA